MMRRYLLGVLLDDPLLFVLEPHVRAAIDTKVIIIWYLLSGLSSFFGYDNMVFWYFLRRERAYKYEGATGGRGEYPKGYDTSPHTL